MIILGKLELHENLWRPSSKEYSSFIQMLLKSCFVIVLKFIVCLNRINFPCAFCIFKLARKRAESSLIILVLEETVEIFPSVNVDPHLRQQEQANSLFYKINKGMKNSTVYWKLYFTLKAIYSLHNVKICVVKRC